VTDISGASLREVQITWRAQSPRPFSPDQVALLRTAGRPTTWNRGSFLLTEGERAGDAFLIERGKVKISVVSDSGYTTLLAFRGPGELLGELSALDSRARSATATAMSAVQATRIPAAGFRRLLEQHGALTLAVLNSIVGRLRESDRRRAEFGGHSAGRRVAQVLAELAERHGQPPAGPGAAKVVAITQQELASAAGTSRESVVRSLREMHRDGLIKTSRGKVIVLDPNLLAAAVNNQS
jgi:CRP/FNR family cyclic AMP-dependent transcriptional regulator